MRAALADVATVRRARVRVVATHWRSNAFSASARIGLGALVAVIAVAADVGIDATLCRVAGIQRAHGAVVAGIDGPRRATATLAGVAHGALVAIIAISSSWLDLATGSRITGVLCAWILVIADFDRAWRAEPRCASVANRAG